MSTTWFRLLGASDLAALERRAQQALGAWCEQWSSAGALPALRVAAWEPPQDGEASSWRYGQSGALPVAAAVPDAVRLLAWLSGSAVTSAETTDPLVRQTADGAVPGLAQDFLMRMAPSQDRADLRWTDTGVPACYARARSGAAMIEIAASIEGPALLRLGVPLEWLMAEAPRRQPARPVPTAPRLEAIGDATLRIEVVMIDDQLTVGDLKDMRVGDTLSFGISIADPLTVVTASGARIGLGRLGAVEGRRAILTER